jgi:hypothetical protein
MVISANNAESIRKGVFSFTRARREEHLLRRVEGAEVV